MNRADFRSTVLILLYYNVVVGELTIIALQLFFNIFQRKLGQMCKMDVPEMGKM